MLEYYRVKSKGVTESLREAGNDEEALEQILQPTGIIRRRVSLDGKWYRDASEAMLGRKKDSKSLVALLPDGWGGYRYHDPDTGRKVRVRRKNADQIEREAILLYRPFPQEKLTMGSLLRFMLQLISLGDIVMLAASMLTVTGVGLLIPYLNNKLFSEVAHSGSTTALVGTGVFMICAAISRLLFSTIQALMTARITEKISFSTRAAAMMRVLALPSSFFRKFSAGEMSKRSGYISEMCRQIANMVLNTGLSAVLSLVYLSQIFIYAPALVLPSLLVTLATLAVLAAHVLIQIKFSRRSMLAGGRESGLAYQMISGIRKIRLSGAERCAFARWGKAYAEAAKYTYSPPVFLKISSVITLAISLAGTILLYYVSVRSGVSVAEYYAFNSAYGMVNSAFLALSGAAAGAAQFRPMREMADNDILFDPSRAEDVRSIMEESGFTTELFEKGPHDIYHKKPVSNFEMHRTLFAEGTDFYKYYKDVKDRLLPAGGCGYAFSPEDFYVYMICHEYKHYSGGGTGLRSLLDTYVYLKKKSPDMDYIGREAEKLGIAEFERGNRSLACRLFSGRGLTEKNKEMLRFILSSGTYGTLSNQVRNAVRANGGSKIRYMLRRFFPPVRENDKEYKQFAAQYPFAYRHKALIPLLIVFRAGRGLIRGTLIRELKILWKA